MKKIKITKCEAFGILFSNLTPGSTHLVVSAPAPHKDDGRGVWVMGNGEPVKVLNGSKLGDPKEYEVLLDNEATERHVSNDDLREFPCSECETGEMIAGITSPSGRIPYECNECGHHVSFP